MKYVYFFITGLFLTSCIQDPVSNSLGGYITDEEVFNELMDTSDLHHYLKIPFDTNEVIKSLNIVDYVNRLDLVETDNTEGLSEKLDTLIMYDMFYACTCPNWRIYGTTDSSAYFHENEYNDYEFYIDPATKELDIECNVTYSPNTSVMFIGKKYKEPIEDGVMHEASPAGLQFRYYYYKILTPYTVYGPETISKDNETEPSYFEITAPQTPRD